MDHYLCIDIGGTNIKVAVADQNGRLSQRQTINTARTKELFITQLKQLVSQHRSQISGVAISVPGKVDRQTQIVYFGGMLPFLNGLNFSHVLREFSLPVYVENDGKAATLAELWQGSLQNVNNGAAIVLGTAVGGGVIANGQLLYGAHFQAGEFSFMMDRPDLSGEQIMVAHNASGVEMIKDMNKVSGYPKLNDGRQAFKTANDGDHRTLKVLSRYCRNIAQLILNIQAVIDGEKIAIGGGVSAQPLLFVYLNRAYDELIHKQPIIAQTLTRPEIVPAVYRNDANMVGALFGLKQHNEFVEVD